MAETLEFNDIYQEVKGSMVRRAWVFNAGQQREGRYTFCPLARACFADVGTLGKESEYNV